MTNHDINLIGINTDLIQNEDRVLRKHNSWLPTNHLSWHSATLR